VFNRSSAYYRDKRVVGVFEPFSVPLQQGILLSKCKFRGILNNSYSSFSAASLNTLDLSIFFGHL
jgi:hypothetical protein